MTTVLHWTGYEARALRFALRLSVRGFAEHLGVSQRTVSSWESRLAGIRPQPAMQDLLDAGLAQASFDARARFIELARRDPAALVEEDHPEAAGGALDGPAETEASSKQAVSGVGKDGVMPSTRRSFLAAGAAAAILPTVDLGGTSTNAQGGRPATRGTVDQLLADLEARWHTLVRTDNLLGPQHALHEVLEQLSIIEAMLDTVSITERQPTARLAAWYAESASWLYEDSRDFARAASWSARAMEWAHEAADQSMVAWTLFRRSQQATYTGNAAQVLGLAHAARRAASALLGPMQAAITQQEAHGHALEGDEQHAQSKIDEARRWEVADGDGDAREGHGSFCTAAYLEAQRARCLLILGKPRHAADLYQQVIPQIPEVYHRDRGAALSNLAAAYATNGDPVQAASTAVEALRVAKHTGSNRILTQTVRVADSLRPHRGLRPVEDLFDQLTALPSRTTA